MEYQAHQQDISKANNKYMGGEYNPVEESSKFIVFIDANSLYGYAMTNKSPITWFQMDDRKSEIRRLEKSFLVLLKQTLNIQKNFMIFIMNIPLST